MQEYHFTGLVSQQLATLVEHYVCKFAEGIVSVCHIIFIKNMLSSVDSNKLLG